MSASIDKDELREQTKRLVIRVLNFNPDTSSIEYDVENIVDKHLELVSVQITTLLDNLEQSIKQHTVPEGSHLVTRSYVLNAIKFAKSELTKEMK